MIDVIRFEHKMMHIMHRFIIHPGQLFDLNIQTHFFEDLSLGGFLCRLVVLPFFAGQLLLIWA